MKTRKGDFIGRDGVLARREAGLDRRLVQFRLSDPEPLLFHNEAVVRVTCQRRSLLALCGKRLRPVSISGT